MGPEMLGAVIDRPGRGARLIIDLERIDRNVRAIASHVGPDVRVLAVVKAGGYGHGGPHVARAALDGGANTLGVATVLEGIELRRNGIQAPILVLGHTRPDEAKRSRDQRLQIAVGSLRQLSDIAKSLDRGTAPLDVHLKVDTGMHRFGVQPEDAARAAVLIERSPVMNLVGVFTHFSRADETNGDAHTRAQAERFDGAIRSITREGVEIPCAHAANSAGILRHRFGHQMVRAGIGIYGIRPSAECDLLPGMQCALAVIASVGRLDWVAPGETVGYGGTFRADHRTKVALLPIGYADGYMRALSNRAWVGWHGERLPLCGRVSMDQSSVVVPDDVSIDYGDWVVITGEGTHGEPTVEELAALAGTIPYEILTGLGLRLPSYYIRDDKIVGSTEDESPTAAASASARRDTKNGDSCEPPCEF
jgi:alanine racemase